MCIRDFLKSHSGSEATHDYIENSFLRTIDLEEEERVPRLTLNVDDNEFFKSLLDSGGDFSKLKPSRDSHDLLLAAATVCSNWVNKVADIHSASTIKARLKEWIKFLEKSATAVLLRVSDGSSAYKMFETLNDRGLKTSQADLVKSFLFGLVGSSRLSEAQSRWSSMKDTLKEIDTGKEDQTVTFLWHKLIASMESKKFVKSEGVYEFVSDNIRSSSRAVTFLSDLDEESTSYINTYHEGADVWTKSNAVREISVINFFDPKPMRPLLFAIAEKVDSSVIKQCLSLLVSYTVRSIVMGKTRSGVVQSTYADAARLAYTGKITNAADLGKALSNVTISNSDFQTAFANAKFSNSGIARYLLRSLEAGYANESEPWYVVNDDPVVMTLEHIIPKKIDPVSWPSINEEIHRQYKTRLGNLCLLQRSTNSTKVNNFAEGKHLYSASPLHWTSIVGKSDDWGPKEIEERQKQMAITAVKTWAI